MKATFVETTEFTEWVVEHLPDVAYRDLQLELMADPKKGAVMTGCGGLRKVRTADPVRGKGKRGGARVIYLYVPEAKWFFMLDVLGTGRPIEGNGQGTQSVETKGEAMTTKARKPLFERLKQGLEEGIAHAKGELTLRTVEVPEEPPKITLKELTALREQAGMSQAVFAVLLGVSKKTLQSWEQGTRGPSPASRRLIQVFREHPAAVCQSAGLPTVRLNGATSGRRTGGGRKVVTGSSS